MGYELLDHTADLGLGLSGESLDELFAEAVRGLTACMTRLDRVRPERDRRFEIEAQDLGELMVDWLSEILYVFETEGLVLCRASVEIKGSGEAGYRLEARGEGETFDERRHGVESPIKGITYHGLLIAPSDGGWEGRVILDV